jgi:hypothetical protein
LSGLGCLIESDYRFCPQPRKYLPSALCFSNLPCLLTPDSGHASDKALLTASRLTSRARGCLAHRAMLSLSIGQLRLELVYSID